MKPDTKTEILFTNMQPMQVIYRGGNIACQTCHLFFGHALDKNLTVYQQINNDVLQMLKLQEWKTQN
jgi:hypothetical protein